jgi:hypothetical protein
MRFDQYYSEAKAYLDTFKLLLEKQEEYLMTTFIQQGPEVLRKNMGITTDSDWQLVFDRLVFADDILKKCVMNFMPFFKAMVAEHGPSVLRKIFEIDVAKYDSVFEKLMDLVSVSEGALYDHVFRNSEKFLELIRAGKADDLRKQLCLEGDKYESLWIEILELLYDSINSQIQSESLQDKNVELLLNMLWNFPVSEEGR